jgi:class 3 adenylate cyclase/tetratricopeptide (TPR) repeat protein
LIEKAQNFCQNCGQSLREPKAIGDGPQQSKLVWSTKEVTPPHLAKRILSARKAVEGERKFVTVMFADIKDSTSAIEHLDPEDALSVLRPTIQAMLEGVHTYEGTVNRIQGDGVMALFGAPISHEDHAIRACLAALRIQELVSKLPDPHPQVRIGLNSGEVVVRSIHNDLSIDYDAVGPTVHLAARMEQLAGPGKIVITEDTYRLAEGFVDVETLGAVQVKGISTAQNLYELHKHAGNRIRWEVRARRGLTRFVGRAEEMDTLNELLAEASKGRCQQVAIIGEAGLGKSRLIHEFLNSQSVEGWTVYEMGATPYGKNTSFLPIKNFLRTWFQIEERDSQSEAARKVSERIVKIGSDLQIWIHALHSILDLPVLDEQWREMEPRQRRVQIFDAVKSLLLRRVEVSKAVVVIEDLHWMDPESIALLDHLLTEFRNRAIFFVVSFRPEFREQWQSGTIPKKIFVEPLGHTLGLNFLSALLGEDSSLRQLKDVMLHISDSTPLFLEEIARSLVDSGGLVGTKGAYRLVNREVGRILLPATVQAVIAARIDRLEPQLKSLLQTASVIGKDVPLNLLELLVDERAADLLSMVTALQAGEFIYKAKHEPEVEYSFKHALVQEVAYSSLLRQRRQQLHTELALAMERHYHNRIEEHFELLAFHATRGEAWESAAKYCLQAGAKALDRSAYVDAISFFEDGIRSLAKQDHSKAVIENSIDARLRLRDALMATGDFPRMLKCLDEAEALGERISDYARLAVINIAKSIVSNFQGNVQEAINAGLRAQGIADRLHVATLAVGSSFVLGQALQFAGDLVKAEATLSRDLSHFGTKFRLQRTGTGTGSVIHLSTLSTVQASLGEFAKALKNATEAYEIASEVDRPFDLGFANHALGMAHLLKGEIELAVLPLERGFEISDKGGIGLIYPWLACQLGTAYAQLGRVGEGRVLAGNSVQRAKAMKLLYVEAMGECALSSIVIMDGDILEAKNRAEAALSIASRYNYRYLETMALRCLGEALSNTEDSSEMERASTLIERAVAQAKALYVLPEAAHCDLAAGEHLARCGRREEAVRRLAVARERYTELKMLYWETEAQSRISALGFL